MKTERPPKTIPRNKGKTTPALKDSGTPFIKGHGDTTTRTSTNRFKPHCTAAVKAQINVAIQRHFAEQRENGKPVRAFVNAFWTRDQARNAKRRGKFKSKPPPAPARNGEIQKEITELLARTRTFAQWLAVFDGSGGKPEIRHIAFEQARAFAKTPVEFLELYFRADKGTETAIVRKIKRLTAPPDAWLAFLLLHSTPTKLTKFVVTHRVSRTLLARWHAQAVDGDTGVLAEHLGLPKQTFGKVVLGRPP